MSSQTEFYKEHVWKYLFLVHMYVRNFMLPKIVSLLIRKKGKFLFATSLHFLDVLERKEKDKKHFVVTKILSDLFSWTGQRSRGDTQKAPLPATLRA